MTEIEEEILKRITDQLYWDNRVDATNINIQVDGRTVELSGSVPSYSARQAAIFNAWSSKGVQKVINEIQVKYPPAMEIPSDNEIKTNIQSILEWNPNIDEGTLTVEVKNGHVTLEGSVDAYWKKVKAEQSVSGVIGVLDITNKLVIVPTKAVADEEIAQNIVAAIDRKISVDVESVNVKVVDGKVTLSGTVSNWDAHNEAKQAAELTEGVKDVEDQILIA
ncbi:MAG: BON domain-containing protein [Candidatus Heimdallarchaeota archaeon]|nr:BON domain-containing protein [Candidatus Heimdallarchaeota archaeon]